MKPTRRLDAPTEAGAAPGQGRSRRLSSGTRPKIDASFVAREAGDQTMPPTVFAEHRKMREVLGDDLFVQMIRAMFPRLDLDDKAARALWWEIVAHRKQMRARLGRRVPIIVAALDLVLRTRDPDPLVVVDEESFLRSIGSTVD